MQVLSDVNLKPYTTFHIGGPADFFVYAQNDEDIIAAVQYGQSKNLPLFVFGGGSNVLVSDTGFRGLAIRTETIGIDIAEDTPDYTVLKVASGEVWDDVVRFAVEQNLFGIENLSHIPGFMGGFSVQNVGAYGQEASGVVTEVVAYNIASKEIETISNKSCNFSYRSSIFNTTHRGEYVILYTLLKLSKNGSVNLSYGDVAKYFSDANPTISEVRNAIITIRNTKFPFPNKPSSGNAGSFFNAPTISKSQFLIVAETIKHSFGMEAYNKLLSISEDKLKVAQGYKIPYAFLIQLCGLKGFRVGGAKVNEPHPGVILNDTGMATASEVLKLAHHVIKTVHEKTGVELRIEPTLIGF